jgi:hypothetical protein
MAFGLGKMLGGGILAVGGVLVWATSDNPRLSPILAGSGAALWGIGFLQMRRARAVVRSPNSPLRLATRAVASRVRAYLPDSAPDGVEHTIASRIVSEASLAGAFASAREPEDVVSVALRFAERILTDQPEVIARLVEEETPKPPDLSAVTDIRVNDKSGVEVLRALEGATGLLARDLQTLVSSAPTVSPSDLRLVAAQCVQEAWGKSMRVGTSTFQLQRDGLALFNAAHTRYGSLEHAVAALSAARSSMFSSSA